MNGKKIDPDKPIGTKIFTIEYYADENGVSIMPSFPDGSNMGYLRSDWVQTMKRGTPKVLEMMDRQSMDADIMEGGK